MSLVAFWLRHSWLAVQGLALSREAICLRDKRSMDLLDKDGDCIHFIIDASGKLKEPLGKQSA